MRPSIALVALLCGVFLGVFALPGVAQAAPDPHPACLAGFYDGGQTEMAAGLVLRPDGQFEYSLSYGALDEMAEGSWEYNGTHVLLTSDAVVPPAFALVEDTKGAAGQLTLKLDTPPGISPQYFHAIVRLADGRSLGRQLTEDGVVFELPPGVAAVSVMLHLPVLSLDSDSFAIAAGEGGAIRIRFEANDLGKAAFANEALKLDRGALLLDRHDRSLRFRPSGAGCGAGVHPKAG